MRVERRLRRFAAVYRIRRLRRGVLLAILALALVGYGSGSVARADSGGATVRTLPESSELQANVTVEHYLPGLLIRSNGNL